MIIIAHGSPNSLQFDSDGTAVSAGSLRDSFRPAFDINLIDIQACYGAKEEYFGYLQCETSIANEFIMKPEVKKVYAWTGKCKMMPILSVNYSPDGGSYIELNYSNGNIYTYPFKTDKTIPVYDGATYSFIDRPAYLPLQNRT